VIGPRHLGAMLGIADCADDLKEIIRRRKNDLKLSNEWIDLHTESVNGNWDKYFGISSQKPLSHAALDRYLQTLGCTIAVFVDPAAEAKMRDLWEKRDGRQLRPAARFGRALMARAMPAVAKELGRRGGVKTWRKIPDPRLRSRLMGELAKLRWRPKRSALAPEPQQETAAQ